MATDLSLGELFERLVAMLPEYLDSSVVFVALMRPDGNASIEFFHDHGEIRRYPHIVLSEGSRALAVMKSGEIIWGNEPGVWAPEGSRPINKDRPWTNDSMSAIFVPMTSGGKTVGCLSVQSRSKGAYTQQIVDVIAAIGHYLGVAVENQRMYQALQRTAQYDQLTGLANYSKVARSLDESILKATSVAPALAMVFNVVNFAAFNSTYGYAEGDVVLRRIADTLRTFEEDGVEVGRFGGDTFILVAKETHPDRIAAFVERVHKALSELAYVARDQTLPVSVACGYAVVPLDGGNRHDVVALCVDRAKLSRLQGCIPTGTDELNTFALHGSFEGLGTIVSALLEGDPYTRMHLVEVNHMAKLWSEHNLALDHDSLTRLLQASLLHDVGKLLISHRILVKPGHLSGAEYEDVKRHAAFGRHILSAHPGYEEVADIVGQHHERWDGTGYPQGLAGADIHPLARAVAVLDAFSAMVADRPYHRGITEDAALAELQRCSGAQFDAYYVERFVAWRESGEIPPTNRPARL
ncbi:MAG TPA: HD domain-containing phosphohydrolase [Candidatus Acidoferrales bacterium]|nr:HD domain-containing phosphohydrolase [Candidatus Acidoferrales bacterium]